MSLAPARSNRSGGVWAQPTRRFRRASGNPARSSSGKTRQNDPFREAARLELVEDGGPRRDRVGGSRCSAGCGRVSATPSSRRFDPATLIKPIPPDRPAATDAKAVMEFFAEVATPTVAGVATHRVRWTRRACAARPAVGALDEYPGPGFDRLDRGPSQSVRRIRPVIVVALRRRRRRPARRNGRIGTGPTAPNLTRRSSRLRPQRCRRLWTTRTSERAGPRPSRLIPFELSATTRFSTRANGTNGTASGSTGSSNLGSSSSSSRRARRTDLRSRSRARRLTGRRLRSAAVLAAARATWAMFGVRTGNTGKTTPIFSAAATHRE